MIEEDFYGEDPCSCWCDLCGCHGYCFEDEEEYPREEEDKW